MVPHPDRFKKWSKPNEIINVTIVQLEPMQNHHLIQHRVLLYSQGYWILKRMEVQSVKCSFSRSLNHIFQLHLPLLLYITTPGQPHIYINPATALLPFIFPHNNVLCPLHVTPCPRLWFWCDPALRQLHSHWFPLLDHLICRGHWWEGEAGWAELWVIVIVRILKEHWQFAKSGQNIL